MKKIIVVLGLLFFLRLIGFISLNWYQTESTTNMRIFNQFEDQKTYKFEFYENDKLIHTHYHKGSSSHSEELIPLRIVKEVAASAYYRPLLKGARIDVSIFHRDRNYLICNGELWYQIKGWCITKEARKKENSLLIAAVINNLTK